MYILCIFIIILMWEFSKVKVLTLKKRNKLIFISGLILFLFAALRHEYVGRDVPLYFNRYVSFLNISFESAIKWFSNGTKDPGYNFAAWICGRIFDNPQWWLAIIAAFYTYAVFKVIKRYSIEPCMSIVAFLMLGFLSFSLTGLRQTIAMGFTLLAFNSCVDRKLIKFSLLIVIASFFHRSSLVFFIAYPIFNWRFNIWHIIILGVSIVAFIFFKDMVRVLLFDFLEDSTFNSYTNYEKSEKAYTLMNFFIQGCMLIFTGFNYKKVIEKYSFAIWLYNMSMIGVVLQLFASMLAEIFRLSMYFSISNIFLIPMAIYAEEDYRMQQIEYYVVFGVLLLYIFLRGDIDYAFFWQNI